MLTKKNAFAVWLLVGLTLGIYALVMYERLNRELHAVMYHEGLKRPAWARWWSQLVPVYGIVGLHRTAGQLNRLAFRRQIANGETTRKVAGPVSTWLFWSWFFVGSYAYLQHAANKVHA